MAEPTESPWAPLSNRVFRMLWLAGLGSNLGSWVHDLGASWLMTDLTPSPLWVSLVQAATSLPIFVLALPAGALADVVDRRRLLLGAQLWMLLSAVVLSLVTASGHTTPALLLLATASLALGSALSMPAWQALLPELVKPGQLAPAIALNGLSINLARTIGPALGGLLVASQGPAAAFAFNALTFGGILVVLARWHRPVKPQALPAERWFAAVRVGLRYVRYSPAFRGLLRRALAYFPWAAALWALLPLIARREMGLSAGGYGLVMGSMGLGAVLAAFMMPRLRRKFSLNKLLGLATLVFAAVMAALSSLRHPALVCLVMAVAGGAWLTTMSGFGVAAQTLLPGWVRARALAVYLVVFFGCLAAGSALWGVVATRLGIQVSLGAASAGLLISLILVRRDRLEGDPKINLTPSRHYPVPEAAQGHDFELDYDQGPVLVRVEYRVRQDALEEFQAQMAALRLQRLRGGALEWALFVEPTRPEVHWELFLSGTWLEHLRQHERLTVSDRELINHIRTLLEEPPDVRHLVAQPAPARSPKP